jgi:hypothetical protein
VELDPPLVVGAHDFRPGDLLHPVPGLAEHPAARLAEWLDAAADTSRTIISIP